jgi:hypothetical protein
MTTATDLITGALINLNAYAPGQPLGSNILQNALGVLNDLLDSLSTDKAFIYTQTENIVSWTPGQYKYTVGNGTGGTFSGYPVSGQPTLVGVVGASNITISNSYNGSGLTPQVGPGVSDLLNAIPTGATMTAYTAGTTTSITFTGAPSGTTGTLNSAWTGVTGYYLVTLSDGETIPALFTHSSTAVTFQNAITGTPLATGSTVNTTTVTLSANCTATWSTPDTITYTSPGNFSFPRPLRIHSCYTRITTGVTGLDYWIDVQNSMERYNEIGFKGVAGPWPVMLAYQPTYPLGTIWVYPNPSTAGEVHLFTDYILSEFTSATQTVSLPQGYNRALKKLLALELAPQYGKTPSPLLITQAKEAKELLMDLNSSPVTVLRYDSGLIYGRHADAGWILDGGFNR